MRFNSLAFLLTSLSFFIVPAVTWGSLGHRTVTAVALLYFHEGHPVRRLLTELLHGQDPTTAALFPDRIRYIPSFAYTAPWHYIDARDNPPVQCSINMTRDCLPSEGCVVTAIANHTSRVANLNLPLWERGQSLRFMLHFFGDIHQPLHTENLGRGGNEISVIFNGARTNLHSVWDTLIPKKIIWTAADGDEYYEDTTSTRTHLSSDTTNTISPQRWDPTNETQSAYAWASFLHTRYASDPKKSERHRHGKVCTHDATDCALEWATESNSWVCEYILRDGVEGVQTKDLGGEYFEGAVPIVEELIFKGGRRLAAWLKVVVAESHGMGSGITENDLDAWWDERSDEVWSEL